MPFTKETWVDGQLPADTAAEKNRIEQAIADLYNVAYAEDMTEVTSTATGGYTDPTTGTVGPDVAFTVPAGGRFVDFAAECQAKHSANNTDGIWFVLRFSKDGGAYTHEPLTYDTDTPFMDTTTTGLAMGASMWFADATYRPLRMGQARTPNSNGTTSFLWPSATRIWLPAAAWHVKFGYGIKSGGGGTAYFKSRRLRAQVLPN